MRCNIVRFIYLLIYLLACTSGLHGNQNLQWGDQNVCGSFLKHVLFTEIDYPETGICEMYRNLWTGIHGNLILQSKNAKGY